MRGLSLLEVAFALGLLSIFGLLTMALLPSLIHGSQKSARELQAGAIAQNVLEQYRARPYPRLTLGHETMQPVQTDEGSFTGSVDISVVPGEANADRVCRVAVTVEWDQQQIHRSLRHELYVAKIQR